MRKALVVGVNYYDNETLNLSGCVPDAYAVNSVLEHHSDGTKNFDTMLKVVVDKKSRITRSELKTLVEDLYKDDCEIAVFYFSGHGFIESTGGYLITSDAMDFNNGLSMNELLIIVNKSKAKNKIIILDTCHSGAAGNFDVDTNISTINEGVTILTSSQKNEPSVDEGVWSTFTKLFVDALGGSAANLLGEISPGSVYAHIDQALGAWEQRPVFKTNVKSFVCLRKVQPSISIEDLKKLPVLFEDSFELKLDPTYEPESDCPNDENTVKFSILQKYNRVNLVIPVDAPHMYYAAMQSKSCKLTVLGEYYWELVKKKRI